MQTNQFKKGIAPVADAISQTIGRNAKPIQKLNPPKFEEAIIDMRNPGIAWGFSLERMKR